jgi:hypothetical protein
LPAGHPLYVYSAVFSPTALNTNIVHEWQTYDERRGWITADRISLPIRGGRGGGYRTFSTKSGLRAGAWRVNIETPNGALLGRLRFNVSVLTPSDALPSLDTEIRN